MLISIMAEMILIKQVAANWIDTGQQSPSAPMISIVNATYLTDVIIRRL
jgi:hypothetical protein